MILLTRPGGQHVFANPDRIETVEDYSIAGQTMIKFVEGRMLVCLETPQEVADLFVAFRKQLPVTTVRTTRPERAR